MKSSHKGNIIQGTFLSNCSVTPTPYIYIDVSCQKQKLVQDLYDFTFQHQSIVLLALHKQPHLMVLAN